MSFQSLKKQEHVLSDSGYQLRILNDSEELTFLDKLKEVGFDSLQPSSLEVMQVNIGKMCNQTCVHCHVDAGPDRKEIMTMDTMKQCLNVLSGGHFNVLDITGGAPEMNPMFRWFVEEAKKMDIHILVRCNLTIILANPSYYDLPEFYADNQVEIVSSLPHFAALRTDKQRGTGVFDKSIQALKQLNEAGYGKVDSDLKLNLVYNPSGAFLSPDQVSLERDFRRKLSKKFGVTFNNLYAITNMPISRYLDFLISSGNYDAYLEKLVNAFNPSTIDGLMCRSMVSVGWDGGLYDCDFNQMLDLEVNGSSTHISEFDPDVLIDREIRTAKHCFGCTAGAGSSCGGEIA